MQPAGPELLEIVFFRKSAETVGHIFTSIGHECQVHGEPEHRVHTELSTAWDGSPYACRCDVWNVGGDGRWQRASRLSATTGRQTRGGWRRGTCKSPGVEEASENVLWRQCSVERVRGGRFGLPKKGCLETWIEQEALSSIHRSIRRHQGVVSLSISGGGSKTCLGMASW